MNLSPNLIPSICVYCGSCNGESPNYLLQSQRLGRLMAEAGVRLVYGGGDIGLMGAVARAASEAGGLVLGIMPEFLRDREVLFDGAQTIVVKSMHERKMLMFDESDAFVVLPGGVGTLEEIIELLSWRKLDLHAKPVVFLDIDDFWAPLFTLIDHTINAGFTPASFRDSYVSVKSADEILPALGMAALSSAAAPV